MAGMSVVASILPEGAKPWDEEAKSHLMSAMKRSSRPNGWLMMVVKGPSATMAKVSLFLAPGLKSSAYGRDETRAIWDADSDLDVAKVLLDMLRGVQGIQAYLIVRGPSSTLEPLSDVA